MHRINDDAGQHGFLLIHLQADLWALAQHSNVTNQIAERIAECFRVQHQKPENACLPQAQA